MWVSFMQTFMHTITFMLPIWIGWIAIYQLYFSSDSGEDGDIYDIDTSHRDDYNRGDVDDEEDDEEVDAGEEDDDDAGDDVDDEEVDDKDD